MNIVTQQSYSEKLKKLIRKVRFKLGFPLPIWKIERIPLPSVTLVVIDCVDYARAKRAFDHCRFYCNFGAVKLLTHFDVDDEFIVKIHKLNSIEAYNDFVLKKLAHYFDTEHVLIAQWDGYVWQSQLWDPEFLKYDYIGAPWTPDQTKDEAYKSYLVGNGGFSIRSKRLQEFLMNDSSIVANDSEDVVICQYGRQYLEQNGFRFAPLSLATKFSSERYENAFGTHNIWHLVLNKPLRPLWIKIYNFIHYGLFTDQVVSNRD